MKQSPEKRRGPRQDGGQAREAILALDDSEASIRADAARLLGTRPDPAVLGALTRRLGRERSDGRRVAADSHARSYVHHAAADGLTYGAVAARHLVAERGQRGVALGRQRREALGDARDLAKVVLGIVVQGGVGALLVGDRVDVGRQEVGRVGRRLVADTAGPQQRRDVPSIPAGARSAT